jgi:hypothetical protein
LFSFQNDQDALDAFTEIESNYDGHSSAARKLAEEFFDSESVLSHLLSRCQR